MEFDAFSAQMAIGIPPTVDPSACAVVVVDMVNDYLLPDGVMPVAEPETVISATKELVHATRAVGGPVVWVRPGHTESVDGLFRKRTPHAIGEVSGSQVHADLDQQNGEKVIRKRRYSAFFSTDLDIYLREHGIRSVLLCGVALNICVRSTAHDAFFLGYDVFVVEEACKATGQREHDSTLYDISTHFGTVLSLEEAKAALQGRTTDSQPTN